MNIVNPIMRAAAFADQSHKGQVRKYTGQPYILHPARVAGRSMLLQNASEDVVCAAWLHDVPEDCDVSLERLLRYFSTEAVGLVSWLTNPSKGSNAPRAVRKKMDRDHIAAAPLEARQLKLLDRIDNIREMGGAEPDFARLYAKESGLLLDAIGHSDESLASELHECIKWMDALRERA